VIPFLVIREVGSCCHGQGVSRSLLSLGKPRELSAGGGKGILCWFQLRHNVVDCEVWPPCSKKYSTVARFVDGTQGGAERGE